SRDLYYPSKSPGIWGPAIFVTSPASGCVLATLRLPEVRFNLLTNAGTPVGMDLVAFCCEQADGLVKREPDDIAVGTHQLDHECPGQSLDTIAAGLVAPFAGGEVTVDLLLRKALETNAAFHELLPQFSLRRSQAEAGIDTM